MRTPKRYVSKDGSVSFHVRYRLDGQSTSTTFRGPEKQAKAQAQAFAAMIDAVGPHAALEWQRREDEDRTPANPLTLDQWSETYIDTRTAVTEGTRHGYRRTYALSYGRLVGGLPLEQITHADIAMALNKLATAGGRHGTGYSDKSIKNAHGLLASMFKEALAEGIISSNPCARIKLPRATSHTRAQMVLLSRTDFEQLVEKIPEHYRPLVITLGGTGIRWGEAEAVEVRDVNLEAKTIRINKAAKWDTRKSRREVGPTKTTNSDRTVVLPARVVEVLQPLVEGRPRNARLFVAPRGGSLVHKTFWDNAWVPACEAAKLVDPRPRIHDLRHAHAAWLIEAGVPMPIISRRLGHHSISVTVDTYGHLLPDVQRAAIEAADHVFNTPAAISA